MSMSLSLRLRKILHLRPMARVLLQGLYAEGLRRSNTFSAKAGKRTEMSKGVQVEMNMRQKIDKFDEFENQNGNADSAV